MERQQALEILQKYTKNKNLVNHGLAVEGAMKHFAEISGEDVNYWGNIGLLHDVDYEMYPEEHLQHTAELLKPLGVDDDMLHAINSHGFGICSDVEPTLYMEKVLFAIDELTGLIVACALVSPDKKLANVEVANVLKKWKKKDFARGANREVISKGAEMVGMPLEELIAQTLEGMKKCAENIGL